MLFQYGYFNWKTFDYTGCNLRFSRWGGGWGGGGGERVGNKSRLLTVKTTREKRESISRRYDSSIDKAGSRVEGWRARGFGGWPGCKQPFLWTIKQYRKISRSSCFQFNRPNGKLFATPAKYREAVAKLRVETPGFPSREREREREKRGCSDGLAVGRWLSMDRLSILRVKLDENDLSARFSLDFPWSSVHVQIPMRRPFVSIFYVLQFSSAFILSI